MDELPTWLMRLRSAVAGPSTLTSEEQALQDMSPVDAYKFATEAQNARVYSPEEAASNRQQTLLHALYVSPLGNALSARDAMEHKWRAQDLEALGDAEGAQRAYAEAAASAGMAFLPGMGRIGLGKTANTVAREADTTLPAILAYHGSPHDFERFDMSRIGTGEGAQAYGHGLYFAENPEVAKSYKEALAHKNQRPASPQPIDPDNPFMGTPLLEQDPTRPGRVYNVELDVEPHQLLDWDKPLSEQGPEVKAALSTLGINSGAAANPWGLKPQASSDPTGDFIMRGLQARYYPGADAHAKAAQVLREAGIPGIRYLDQGSRDTGEGTHNIVMFDDNLIKMLGKE